MSEFTLVSSEVQDLTPNLAREFKEMKPTPTERLFDPVRVQNLKQKIEDGLAVPFQWATVTVKSTGDTFRANGQHSSTMLCEMDGKLPKGLKVHLDRYEVPDMHGAVVLFRQIDDRRSSRTAVDVAGVYQGVVHNLEKIDRKVAKLGVDGVGWWRRHIEGVPVLSGDGIYDLFNETGLHSFLLWLGETIEMKTPELKAAAIVAAMYATFISGEEQARKFWHDVARGGVEYEDGHPTTILDEWLKRAKADPDLKLSPGNLYQGCIYAWNGARESKIIKDIKHDTRKGFLKVL
jgi:hypothetical protein